MIAEAMPFNSSTQGGGAKVPYSCCIQSEFFCENLKIHVGSDNKLRIQFVWPIICHTVTIITVSKKFNKWDRVSKKYKSQQCVSIQCVLVHTLNSIGGVSFTDVHFLPV